MGKITPLLVILSILTSCTLSFQNVSTHGEASDVIDENQDPTANVSASLMKPI